MTDPLTFLLEGAALALALVDRLIDAARDDGIFGAWRLLADAADIADSRVRDAVTVALTANLESVTTSISLDAGATPRVYWPAFSTLAGDLMRQLERDDLKLPIADRPECEPVDWGSRIVLWCFALGYATAEPFGVPRPGDAA